MPLFARILPYNKSLVFHNVQFPYFVKYPTKTLTNVKNKPIDILILVCYHSIVR